jgi:hypothetical protein
MEQQFTNGIRIMNEYQYYYHGVTCSVMRGGLCICAMENALEGREMINFLIANKKLITQKDLETLSGEPEILEKFVRKIEHKIEEKKLSDQKRIEKAAVVNTAVERIDERLR